MLKFCQKEGTTKDFYGQRQITDIMTIDVNKVAISDKVLHNNGKDCRYIVGYQVDEALILLLIKTPKIYLVMACHNAIKTLPIQCHSMSLRQGSGCLNIKRFGMRLSHIWKKMTTESGTSMASWKRGKNA